MSKALRLSEKWFRRGLWLVALVFAGFLIGLGGTVVGDLPRVEKALSLDDFMDPAISQVLRQSISQAERAGQDADAALAQAQFKRRAAQDSELVARTRALDGLRDSERAAGVAVEAQQQAALDAQHAAVKARRQLEAQEQTASTQLNAEVRRVELRVFLYRLALTLPLLAAAAWLFVKNAAAPTGRLCGASSCLRCSPFSSSWCLTCPAMAAMCAMWWALG